MFLILCRLPVKVFFPHNPPAKTPKSVVFYTPAGLSLIVRVIASKAFCPLGAGPTKRSGGKPIKHPLDTMRI